MPYEVEGLGVFDTYEDAIKQRRNAIARDAMTDFTSSYKQKYADVEQKKGGVVTDDFQENAASMAFPKQEAPRIDPETGKTIQKAKQLRQATPDDFKRFSDDEKEVLKSGDDPWQSASGRGEILKAMGKFADTDYGKSIFTAAKQLQPSGMSELEMKQVAIERQLEKAQNPKDREFLEQWKDLMAINPSLVQLTPSLINAVEQRSMRMSKGSAIGGVEGKYATRGLESETKRDVAAGTAAGTIKGKVDEIYSGVPENARPNRELTSTEIDGMLKISDGYRGARDLLSIFDQDDNNYWDYNSKTNTFKNPDAQAAITKLKQYIGRVNSGAAISGEEWKTFEKLSFNPLWMTTEDGRDTAYRTVSEWLNTLGATATLTYGNDNWLNLYNLGETEAQDGKDVGGISDEDFLKLFED